MSRVRNKGKLGIRVTEKEENSRGSHIKVKMSPKRRSSVAAAAAATAAASRCRATHGVSSEDAVSVTAEVSLRTRHVVG